jgi:S1-C subfamily serine protease
MLSTRGAFAVSSVVCSLIGTLSCGGSTLEPNDVPVAGSGANTTPRGSVTRAAVVEAVDAGLGAFLQRIQVEPVTRDGAYLGFQLKAVDPAGGWSAYDIQVGDIVTHANGKSLEAEASAFEVFQQLRSANEIKLSVIRDGVSRQVVIPIVGDVATAERAKDAPAAEPSASESASSG